MGAETGAAAAEEGAPGQVQAFAASPAGPESEKRAFRRHQKELIRLLGLDVPPKATTYDRRRVALVEGRKAFIRRAEGLSEDFFEPLVGAAVHEPNPSACRWFVEPAINAFGRRRVREGLLVFLRTGTNRQRAGAARAWYWTDFPLKQLHLRAGTLAEATGAEADESPDIVAAWREATLREFIANEDWNVRSSILPRLRLNPASYPPELHDLIDTAVAIARSHPHAYIRHRVEIQIHQ